MGFPGGGGGGSGSSFMPKFGKPIVFLLRLDVIRAVVEKLVNRKFLESD